MATAYSFILNTSEHIKAIPINFYTYLFLIDLRHSPQINPEFENQTSADKPQTQMAVTIAALNNVYDLPSKFVNDLKGQDKLTDMLAN